MCCRRLVFVLVPRAAGLNCSYFNRQAHIRTDLSPQYSVDKLTLEYSISYSTVYALLASARNYNQYKDAAEAGIVGTHMAERDHVRFGSTRLHHHDYNAFPAKIYFSVHETQRRTTIEEHFEYTAEDMADILSPSRIQGARAVQTQPEGSYYTQSS